MANFLANKHVLLGITGSIAAYKSPDLVRRLRELGADVRVVMTDNAKQFITSLTLQAVSGHPVHNDLFDLKAEAAMGHIELARWADVVLVAPASADFMARLANGNANDLLTTLCVATSAKIAVAPAMNQRMWKHTLTQKNLQALMQQDVCIFGPAEGNQACGDVGFGRMMEPRDILEKLNDAFSSAELAGIKVLLTAGPTHEAIDPVRYLTNHSSGKMGYALAEACQEASANVTVVSGPTNLQKPTHIEWIAVESAQDMFEAVMKRVGNYDIFISVAAVADYRCKTIATHKLHKQETDINLQLTRNPDIVSSVGQLQKKPFIVGFAAETTDPIQSAINKLKNKKMNMIIMNRVGKGIGMESDDNEVTVITNNEQQIVFPRTSKYKLAVQLISLIAKEYHKFISKK